MATLGLIAAVAVRRGDAPVALGPPPPASIGINLGGLAPYNRQQVFANLIAQSEWFASSGAGWTPLPADQLDARGWIRFLRPGQSAPRPLILPALPYRLLAVRCTFVGKGALSADGLARVTQRSRGAIDLALQPPASDDDGAWIQVDSTDPADPLRDIDCRDRALPRDQLFAPAFLRFLQGFAAVRFLDWQRTNDPPSGDWRRRTTPASATQAGPQGVALEYMVELANQAAVDPWFLMPYDADATYVRNFARYVHAHLRAGRIAYVELGNEVWNTMFPATQKAQREGVALKLTSADDPGLAGQRRYAQKLRATMKIWTAEFADRPDRLVRVAASQNVWPDTAAMVLEFEDTARWVDALATAPYFYLDDETSPPRDLDRAFKALAVAADRAIAMAAANRAIAARHGKRFIAYEAGQHVVTPDIAFARRLQRDARMERIYARYLARWRDRIGDRMMLYASSAPIADYGSWGLQEYAGQPASETPKLRAVRAALDRRTP